MLACNPDYHLFTPDRANLEVDELEAPTQGSIESDSSEDETETFEDNQVIHPNEEDIIPNMRLDAAIQHMGWGAQQTRCQIEVAFNRRWFEPREEPDEETAQPEL